MDNEFGNSKTWEEIAGEWEQICYKWHDVVATYKKAFLLMMLTLIPVFILGLELGHYYWK